MTSQIPTAVVENAAAWRRAYMKEFEKRRMAIMQAAAAQRAAALGELDKLLATSGGPPRPGAPAPAKDAAPASRPGAPARALAEQIQRAIGARIAQRIVDSLKDIIAAEVQRQLSAGPLAAPTAPIRRQADPPPTPDAPQVDLAGAAAPRACHR